ncbi:MAG: aminotransferase class I/II-fold pyridoxal phosphate-dependent enzyme [Candidatus ainarchaeum sp.]|nr:aminotransferase class I/II-fold pyridoxal phosphate-dependent enzyme [Candidatus ainarchaeum sp.]
MNRRLKDPRTSQLPRSPTEFFKSRHYKEGGRGEHIEAMSTVMFAETDVTRYMDRLNEDRRLEGKESYLAINASIGDPTSFGITPHEAFFRHGQRTGAFERRKSSSYSIFGDYEFKEMLHAGWRSCPGYMPVPEPPVVSVYVTGGVSGAMGLITNALLLQPPRADEDKLEATTSTVMVRLSKAKSDASERNILALEKTVLSLMRDLEEARETIHRRDNIIVPQLTYPSHLAAAYRKSAYIKQCRIKEDGQMDLESLAASIDRDTRAVLFATIGNPVTVAMEPSLFKALLEVVDAKAQEFGEPILVMADIIYEHFRRDMDKRIDPIQLALQLRQEKGVRVPIVEMSSFSKMFALPGERIGYARIMWDPALFPEFRHDFFRSLNFYHQLKLGEVPTSSQMALASFYRATARNSPVEEKLAPIAAMVSVLRELAISNTPDLKGGYMSLKRVANHMRESANALLQQCYRFDPSNEAVRRLGETLEAAGIVSVRTKRVSGEERVYYKLSVGNLPSLRKVQKGDFKSQLALYGISADKDWIEVAGLCNLPKEDDLFDRYKEEIRDAVHDSTLYFAQGIENMRAEGLGVSLHPSCYDASGKLDPDRLNAFYVLFKIDALAHYRPEPFPSQALQFAKLCVELDQPIVLFTPGELFVMPEHRNDTVSYMRNVALHPKNVTNQILDIIRKVVQKIGEKEGRLSI